MSRHHRKLLRRLRAEWIMPEYPPRLRRGWGGQWCITAGAWLYAHDSQRVRALHARLAGRCGVSAEIEFDDDGREVCGDCDAEVSR